MKEDKCIMNIYVINDLITIIRDSELGFDPLKYDYLKCDPHLKVKYPELFEELEDYLTTKNVKFNYIIDNSVNYPNKCLIELGNSENNFKIFFSIKQYSWLNNGLNTDIMLNLFKIIIKHYGLPRDTISVSDFIAGIKLGCYSDFGLNFDIIKLSLNDRFALADDFNGDISKSCLLTINSGVLEYDLIERHNWLDNLGIIPRELMVVNYYGDKYEMYI